MATNLSPLVPISTLHGALTALKANTALQQNAAALLQQRTQLINDCVQNYLFPCLQQQASTQRALGDQVAQLEREICLLQGQIAGVDATISSQVSIHEGRIQQINQSTRDYGAKFSDATKLNQAIDQQLRDIDDMKRFLRCNHYEFKKHAQAIYDRTSDHRCAEYVRRHDIIQWP